MTEPDTKRIKISNDPDDLSDPSKLSDAIATSDLSDRIKRQVEYYFSDVNIIKDKFMKDQMSQNDGWISTGTLLTFARLKAITGDEDKIIGALKNRDSKIIEIDENNKKIRRVKPPPDEDYRKGLEERTLHLSGFPLDFKHENLVRWCAQFGQTDSVSLRYFFKTRAFKGNIIVVYSKKWDAERLIELSKDSGLKCKDRDIRLEDWDTYKARKAQMAEKRAQNLKNKRKSKDIKKDE